jgi:hypothetical protein
MMKRLAIMALLLQIPAIAAIGETKQGSCELKPSEGFDKDVVRVQIGDRVKGTCKFYITDFLQKKVINAGVQIVNTSDKPIRCQYYVAFFDQAGKLIGCVGQGASCAAGENAYLISCLIPLPEGFHEKVAQYKIAFYESDQANGKEQPTKGAGR